MGKHGPPPKPTRLKELEGETRPSRLPAQEPLPPQSEVVRPSYVTGEARRVWDRLARQLEQQGLLTAWDVDDFAAYCMAVQTHNRMSRRIVRYGEIVRGRDGGWVRNPATIVRTQALADMLRLSARFGLDPSSRASLGVLRKAGDSAQAPGEQPAEPGVAAAGGGARGPLHLLD